MAEQTKIEWVDHTFNPWIGCTRVSPACDNCYAAAMSHRRKWARFEPRAPRRRTSAAQLAAAAALEPQGRGGRPAGQGVRAEPGRSVRRRGLARMARGLSAPDRGDAASRLDPADQASAGGAQVLRVPKGARTISGPASPPRTRRCSTCARRTCWRSTPGSMSCRPSRCWDRSISAAICRASAGSSPAARAGRGPGRPIPTGSAHCARSARPRACRCSSSNGASTART